MKLYKRGKRPKDDKEDKYHEPPPRISNRDDTWESEEEKREREHIRGPSGLY